MITLDGKEDWGVITCHGDNYGKTSITEGIEKYLKQQKYDDIINYNINIMNVVSHENSKRYGVVVTFTIEKKKEEEHKDTI